MLLNRKIRYALVCCALALLTMTAAAAPACDPDNGGIKLPAGFCAQAVADGVVQARHMAVAPNGDLFVTLRRPQGGIGIVALRDTNNDGKMDVRERFGTDGATGIALRNGYLYVATRTAVLRYRMAPGALKPAGEAETIVSGLPGSAAHADKGIAFDGKGSMFVNIGAPSNACQDPDRKARVPGQDPCPLLEKHGGIWRFSESKLGQTQADGERYASGMRQMIALAWHADGLYVAMHGRDQLNTMWPGMFTDQDNAELPSETLMRVERGSNFGWPYCYHDPKQNKLFLNPEYGGDGKKSDRCAQFTNPIMAFPGHWAPNDLMFYTGTQFPEKYRGGAFIAFHGSWNRAPLPQGGYNIVFIPFKGAKPSGSYEVFADGFAGKLPLGDPNDAIYRPEGVATANDGSLYISEGQKGRIWRVFYRGN